MLVTLALAALAGSLSILSPCVLPLLPIVLGTAASNSKAGPLLLASGLVLSFVAIAMFVSLVGFEIGLDAGVFRKLSAGILLLVGLTLAIPLLARRFSIATGQFGNRLNRFMNQGEKSQFLVGFLLGAVWSPCAGPTLGAAALLASKNEVLWQVMLTLVFFGLGVALPLTMLGLISRTALMRWRGRMLSAAMGIKVAMGCFLTATSLLILTGQDKVVEAALVELSPAWLTALTTSI